MRSHHYHPYNQNVKKFKQTVWIFPQGYTRPQFSSIILCQESKFNFFLMTWLKKVLLFYSILFNVRNTN